MTKIATAPIGRFDEALLKKLSSEHSAEQQLWLSGFLYGLATAGQPEAVIAPAQQAHVQAPKVQLLYGSQTGNSKKVAQKAAALIGEQGWDVTVTDLADYAVKNLKTAQIALFVVSTQGEGTPPTAAESFYEWLHSARVPKLPDLQFAVCSLGDSSYLKFCQTGKDFDARLEALGANRLTPRIDCDLEYEEMAEQWAATVVSRLKTVAGAQPAAVLKEQLPKPAYVAGFNRKNPYHAPVLEKIRLNGRGSAKETYHIELGLEGSGLVYEPGDSLGILAHNSDRLVEQVLAAAKFSGAEQVEYAGKAASLASILKTHKELSVLNRNVLEQYAEKAGHENLKAITTDHERLKKYLWGRNAGDLLREFPATLTPQQLTDILRNIAPRLYSIASSLAAHPDEVHLTVSALRYEFGRTNREGLASTFLADRVDVGDHVEVFVERNEYFKLPADDSADIIMVGPGTGVAPFRAFVEERNELRDSGSPKQGRNWLFFGNPNFTTDFLYQREWLQYLKTGALDRLDVAFSRDQQEKIYVQHRLLEKGRQLFERIENGAYCYVCGDKNRMAADVQQAFLQIIARESGKGEAFAAEYLSNLKKQRRYLEDVY
ncbi:MAG: assimilatory sulfite reductase (NADPH) flavoprotein subunit [Saprospiraceae bacterium]|nr:assimilatory sulfite reductase (NADPH) flavoprotein subunit [Saprospiraceae bacterium]